ncbi:hypothetical protein AURDEDRAFT_146991 [Auricularia subglabra TFB-10046 SS5]|uniref:F-box domain-containing protein n=1 Tax=Auricularia subglabra (strain TFB-10046 / SS5) TaxID=717982 RepID=J0LHN4_AURST|nr:hypothetical protein AURDEDRAFT_146991 [Auricularia subglabra TFB-10046 SS5]
MTCSRFRVICSPVLFRSVTLVRAPTADTSTVLRHVRFLKLHHTSNPNTIRHVLQMTPKVVELYCHKVPDAAIPVVLCCPTLETVTLTDVVVTDRHLCGIISSTLQSFRMVFSSIRSRASRRNLGLEMILLSSVFLHSHATLQVLVLPGESTEIATLASFEWPSLRELAICGPCPEFGDIFPRLLAVMPRLAVLTLATFPPHGQASAPVVPAGCDVQPLSELRRLTLSHPNPTDGIFLGLTSSLLELSLRDNPRYYTRLRTDGSVLSCGAATDIIRRLDSRGACQHIHRLELVVAASIADTPDQEMNLYAVLAATCPQLRFLELHRYRRVHDPRDASVQIPWGIIADGLKRAGSLRHLRLNPDFPLRQHVEPDTYRSFLDKLDALAMQLAHGLPLLQSLAFLHSNLTGDYAWQPWSVRPDGTLARALRLRYIESCDMEWM